MCLLMRRFNPACVFILASPPSPSYIWSSEQCFTRVQDSAPPSPARSQASHSASALSFRRTSSRGDSGGGNGGGSGGGAGGSSGLPPRATSALNAHSALGTSGSKTGLPALSRVNSLGASNEVTGAGAGDRPWSSLYGRLPTGRSAGSAGGNAVAVAGQLKLPSLGADRCSSGRASSAGHSSGGGASSAGRSSGGGQGRSSGGGASAQGGRGLSSWGGSSSDASLIGALGSAGYTSKMPKAGPEVSCGTGFGFFQCAWPGEAWQLLPPPSPLPAARQGAAKSGLTASSAAAPGQGEAGVQAVTDSLQQVGSKCGRAWVGDIASDDNLRTQCFFQKMSCIKYHCFPYFSRKIYRV